MSTVSGDGAELINRILVAGPVATVAEFQRRLPVGLRRRVSTSMWVLTVASASDVRDALKSVETEIERTGEIELVEELLENFGGSRVGALRVAEAVADGQVQTLVYARGPTLSGAECVACGWLVPQDAFPLPRSARRRPPGSHNSTESVLLLRYTPGAPQTGADVSVS